MDKEQVRTRFYVEASVALAKSSVFLCTAEDELSRGEFISATISGYYSMFHLASALMWLFADQLPPTVLAQLIDIRDKGGELPSSEVSHARVERFLCDGQLRLSNTKILGDLFRDARKMRKFVNYGPRVIWTGNQPTVGPCDISTSDVRLFIPKIRPAFSSTVMLAAPDTAWEGTLGKIVLQQATVLLRDPQFPFVTWSSAKIHKEALELLEKLHANIMQNDDRRRRTPPNKR